MKKAKRMLAMLLAVVMVLSVVTPASAAFERTKTWSDDLFSDVSPDEWYYESVKTAYELGLMNGDTGGTFRPTGSVTLAETITVAARIHSIYETGTENFVQGAVWYRVYVDYALENDILDLELEEYNRPATRLEFARILARALPVSELFAINRVDDGAIPDVAEDEYVYLLYRAGILVGNDETGRFEPENDIKRSEVAAIVSRMAEPELRKKVELTVETQPDDPQPEETPVIKPEDDTVITITKPEDPGPAGEESVESVPFDLLYPDLFASGEIDYSGEQILIKLDHEPSGEEQAALSAAGVSHLEKFMDLGQNKWYKAYVNDDIILVMEKVRALSFIIVAEYDFAYETETIIDCTPEEVDEDVHGNSDYAEQWYLRSCGIQKGWEKLKHHHNNGPKPDDVDNGDENVGIAGEGVIVAVIDTGVDYTHQDLKDNMWVNMGEVPENGIDDDGNGYIDDYYGWDAVAGQGSGNDDNGHGTHVAGIIAASNNNMGVVGIAYNAKIMTVKAGMASGYFNQSDIAEAIIYAHDNGADVINMSFGGAASSIAVTDALEYAYTNCVLVAAAGNNGLPNEDRPDAVPFYPASLSYVLGVMSVNQYGVESSFTNWDASAFTSIEYELYAPGEAMLSTIPGDRYATWSGTSMAAPVVAGMAALLRAEFYDRDTYPTKFIYGQLAGTGTQNGICCDPDEHGLHNLPKIVDIYAAMTELPRPEVSVSDYVIFDTVDLQGNAKNNGDGVIDAGETIAIGFTLRNRWGKSGETIVAVNTLSQAGISDPYIEILNNDVSYGSVGTYSTQNAGWIKDEDGVYIGCENPIYIKISEDCPDDYIATLNIVVTSTNGLDETDTNSYVNGAEINLNVRRGVVLPNVISEDMTLTADNVYIIPNSMLIQAGATVTVEAGTQIQFWSDDPNDAYAESAITYLKVEGEFICNGTEEAPIQLYPSERMSQYRVEIYEAGDGVVRLFHTEVVNPYLDITYAENCEFTQTWLGKFIYYRKIYSGIVSDDWTTGSIILDAAKNCSFYKLGAGHRNHSSSGDGYALYGRYEECIFVDSALKLYGDYENCVFLGNNNYLDESDGAVSTLTINNNIYTDPNDTQVFTAPDSGRVYVYLRNGDICYFDELRTLQRYAESLGGSLLCINSSEEYNTILDLVRDTNISNNDFAIGLFIDPETGKYIWADGTEPGEFLDIKYVDYGGDIVRLDIFEDIEAGAWSPGVMLEFPTPYVENITLARYEVTLDVESSGYQISATAHPTDVADFLLIYESENPEIATVSSTGLVQAVSTGETVIRVYSPDKYIYNTLNVSVVDPVALESIDAGEDFRLNIGTSRQLVPTLTPADSSKQYLVYSSSNEALASVSVGGLVTGHAAGTVVITVTNPDTGISDSITVEVVIPAESVKAEENICMVSLSGEDSADVLGVSVYPANATYQKLIWESSNPEILSVDENGMLVKGGEGVATLRATVENTELYTDLTVFVSDANNSVTVKQLAYWEVLSTNGSWSDAYMALLDDGSLWFWKESSAVPEKLPFENVDQFAVGSHSGFINLLILNKKGNLNVYKCDLYDTYFHNSLVLDNSPLGGNELSGVAAVASSGLSGSCFVYITETGAAWSWGNNANGRLGIGNSVNQDVAVQMQIDAKIVDVACGNGAVVLLDEDGNAYYSGNNNGIHVNIPTFFDSGVKRLAEIYNCVVFEYEGYIRRDLSGVKLKILGEAMWYANSDSYYYIEDGNVYVKGENSNGVLGLGHTNYVYSYTPMERVKNAQQLFFGYGNNTVYIQTSDGKFYGVGSDIANAIPNASAGDQYLPSRIFFGLNADGSAPTQETNNLVEAVLVEEKLVLDFDRALIAGTNYAAITLKTASGTNLSVTKELRLDKFSIAPHAGFTAGETYTLSIPDNALSDVMGNLLPAMSLTFAVGDIEVTEGEGESEDEEKPIVIPDPVVNEIQINPDVQREKWNAEFFNTAWENYLENGANPQFYNNAILNRLDREDKVETEWLRIMAPESSSYTKYSITGNYWGTTSELLVDKQILDFDDYQQYADLNEGEILTTAPENVWPFAVNAGLVDTDGNEVEVIGNETVTFYVEFNRDMKTDIPLDVRFGSTYPYADYAVEGDWVSARRWEGTTTLTTLIEGGYQYWSIDNGRAADAPLKLYKDWGRFQFEIDNTEAMSMNLWGTATDTGISLEWNQDDYPTLAGYNIYRADTDENAYYQKLNNGIIPVGDEQWFDDTVEPGKVYYYKFTVVFTDLSESEPSGKIQIMSKDTMSPIMYHTPVYKAYVGSNVVISATVTDNLSLQSVTLHYRVGSDGEWISTAMTNLNDKYSAVIGGNNVTLAGIEYYITASDGINTVSKGSQVDPYVITVQENPNTMEKGDVDGDGYITILDALLILRAVNNKVTLSIEQFTRGDLNDDGVLSAAEALVVLKYANGEIGSLQME